MHKLLNSLLEDRNTCLANWFWVLLERLLLPSLLFLLSHVLEDFSQISFCSHPVSTLRWYSAFCKPSPQKMKKKKGYKSRHSFTSTTLSECYRYAVKFMEKWKIQLMLLKTKTKQQNHLQFLIKCIYSFPKVLLWWPAVYSTSLLSLFPSSHSLSNPL